MAKTTAVGIDWRARSVAMHRRAQKAEGELARMKAAHHEAARRAFSSGYLKRMGWDCARRMHSYLLTICNPKLFPMPSRNDDTMTGERG